MIGGHAIINMVRNAKPTVNKQFDLLTTVKLKQVTVTFAFDDEGSHAF